MIANAHLLKGLKHDQIIDLAIIGEGLVPDEVYQTARNYMLWFKYM
jgi:hypothetical protein